MSSNSVKKISILGVTGSVGECTTDVVLSAPERFDVQMVTAGGNVALLAERAKALRAQKAVIADESLYAALKDRLQGTGIEAAAGVQEIESGAAENVDLVMAAIVGFAGLRPIIMALENGVNVAIANKEPLVAAGALVMETARRSGARILPVDSEHNAIFQVFEEHNRSGIDKIILTASGGPFLNWSPQDIAKATVEQAIAHPNWSMGRKISVDSASMMNKALEVIEAHYLFDMPADKIDVVIHPQSVVHSMVSYVDGSVLCQMGASDMRTPVAYALGWPERMQTPGVRLDLGRAMTLTFSPPDFENFKALRYAYDALRAGGTYCLAMNAANEVAVGAFLEHKVAFSKIMDCVGSIMQDNDNILEGKALKTVEEIEELDKTVRLAAARFISH